MGETNRHSKTIGTLGKSDRIRKKGDIRHFSTKLLISEFVKRVNCKKLRCKLLKGKDLNVRKTFEQIQHKTHNRKNEKKTVPEALISTSEKKFKEEPMHKRSQTGKYGTRSKETPKERNCRYYIKSNKRPNHNCPDRESICHNCEGKTTSQKSGFLNTESITKRKNYAARGNWKK